MPARLPALRHRGPRRPPVTPKAILQAIAGLLLVAALAAGGYAAWSYDRMAARVVTLEASAEELEDLKRSVATLSEEAVRRSTLDNAIRDARSAVAQDLQKAANEDPQVARYLSEPIPQRVRDAYRRDP